jgi:F-type H+-transporting ATPase subunit f
MKTVVDFYERLPRGAAPEPKPKGLLQWYQYRYMGNKPSAWRKSDDTEQMPWSCF